MAHGLIEQDVELEIEALIRASAALSWLHRNTCQTLVLIFQTGYQKLASQLDHASTCYLHDPNQLHLSVSPALLLLLKCLEDARHFMESVARCEQEVDQHITQWETSSSANYCSPLSTWSLMRALMLGLDTDAVDAHLHDFLLAYYSVTEAILFSLDKRPDVSVVLEQTWRRADQQQLRQSSMFWSMDRGRPHVFALNDDLVLDRQRKRDVELLRKGLEQRLRKIEANGSVLSENDRKVADFLKANFSHMQGGNVSCSCGFLDLSFDGDMVDVKTLFRYPEYRYWPLSVKEVKWNGAAYALKQFEDLESLPRLTEEAEIYKGLNHPNVLQVRCVLQDEQRCGLLMELMDGTLDDLTLPSEGSTKLYVQLTLSEKVSILLQIAKAMEYLHSKRIIHRDLKPANVLFKMKGTASALVLPQSCACAARRSRTFQIKVADFDVSKHSCVPLVTLTKKVGTSYFRAPEVLNNEQKYSFPADVYSFAMLCFQMLSETKPFDGDFGSFYNLRPDLYSLSDEQCPPYLKHCLETWWHAEPQRRGCFSEICRTLRHLTVALHKCQDPIRELPFLRLPQCLWNVARARANAGFFHWAELQEHWREELKYPDACSKVNGIPYEQRVMKMLVEPWPYQDGFFLLDGLTISLKSVTLGTYITCTAFHGVGGFMVPGAVVADYCEKYRITQHGNTGTFSLQVPSGYFVTVDREGGSSVRASEFCNSAPWQRFFFTRSEDGKRVHIRSAHNGKYLQVNDKHSRVTVDYASPSEPSWGDNAATFEMEQNYILCSDPPINEEWSKPLAGLMCASSLSLHDGDLICLKSVTLQSYVYSHLGGRVQMRRQCGPDCRLMIRLHKNKMCSIRSTSGEYFSGHYAGEHVIATEYFPGECERFYITQNDKKLHIQSVHTGMYLQAKGDYLVVGASKYPPGWDNNAETFEIW